MKTYIALFRGINVGGSNKLPMADLVQLLEEFNLDHIQTYIQSGNVVFRSEEIDTAALATQISNAVTDQFGFTPKVLLLELDEFKQAVISNPFPEADSDHKTLHFYFLASAPGNPDLDKLEDLKKPSERFVLQENILYLHAPDGIGRSKLAAGIEKSLGVSATARNWRSVSKILEMAE
ncbi:MAG TPA: DUF1697 domain-containing protein [bacterium]|nr:DUF1697 domain-containing protein [bacterium]